jgi:hypothetical protein
MSRILATMLPAAVWAATAGAADEPLGAEAVDFFESKIRPVLAGRCYKCHSAATGKVKAKLALDTREGLLRGGAGGAVINPAEPAKSLLVTVLRHADDVPAMPPDNKLPDEVIADFVKWVGMGAPDPRGAAAADKAPIAKASTQMTLEQARNHWSFRPVRKPAVPAVRDAAWPTNEVDRFLLAEMEARGVKPVDPADRRTLLRRATFDLTGLPPTPEELDAFVSDPAPDAEAFARVIDRLLASPAYGERWGRHWMDLVRYADTSGCNSDYPVPQLFRYRNYVIDAFNADKPYDVFLAEQIAGDLMPADTPQQRDERIVATGYVALARRFGSLAEDYPQHLTIEDTIDNLGRTVLGLTINCARCHDHMFDPVSQADYYGLYGIFESTRYPFPGIELDKKPRDFVPLTAVAQGGKADPFLTTAYAVADVGKPADAVLQIRGDPKRPGDRVPRRFPMVLGGMTLTPEQAKGSGRLQLAGWLTDPANPLTARVIVNRIWKHHFGRGIVSTPSDFGARGAAPSHPALLDWLASRFVADGWSFKRMHRRLMLSSAYRLSSRDEPANLAADAENVLRWRADRRRMDAETIRDTLLTLGGNLEPGMPTAPHPFPPADKWKYTQHYPFKDDYPSNRRTVYLMTKRLRVDPYFTTFDGPDRNAGTPNRDSSITAIQALYLLNDPFVHAQAERFAERLLAERPDDPARLRRAFERTLARPPTDAESAAALLHLDAVRERSRSAGLPTDQTDRQAWASFARVLLRLNEFLYVD